MATLSFSTPFFAAIPVSGLTDSHAWVIDGYWEQKRDVKVTYLNGNVRHSTRTRKLVHCNFGWGGFCNGHYVEGVFNLRRGAEEIEGYETSGDEHDVRYDHHFRMVTYDRPTVHTRLVITEK